MIQNWIHRLTEGSLARALRLLAVLLGFAVLAFLYDLRESPFRGAPVFKSPEAMETAQLARNIADGKGYTTLSVAPVNLYLLNRTSNAAARLDRPMPDLATPPAYPLLLAGLFKGLAYHFGTGAVTAPQDLEYWIMGLNQGLFLLAAVLLFGLADRLFDRAVAWTSAGLFVATDVLWQFSVSGLSTVFLLVVFLLILGRLVRLEELEHEGPAEGGLGSSLALGLLIGAGALARYSFAWLAIPAALFLLFNPVPGRWRRCAVMLAAFAVALAPWLIRNYLLTGNFFGLAGFAIFQGANSFPGNTLERSLDLAPALARIEPSDYMDKLLGNTRGILGDELPKLGGNWISAFFLVGFLAPFRKPGLTRLQYFGAAALVLFVGIQALGRTQVSADVPLINTENLLILLAPLAFMFGSALFFTLIEPLEAHGPAVRSLLLGAFFVVLCAPFELAFLTRPAFPESAVEPYYVQRIVNWVSEKDLILSDSPSAVAWYGGQTCVGLPLDDRDQFYRINKIKPVKALYLTRRTTERLMGEDVRHAASWEHFALDSLARGEAPDGFPLAKAPTGFLPERLFLSASDRWSRKNKL